MSATTLFDEAGGRRAGVPPGDIVTADLGPPPLASRIMRFPVSADGWRVDASQLTGR